jgi:hypothetical protein
MSRAVRTLRKHQRIRELFAKNYTNQKRVNGARVYTREYILSKLSEEFYLSIRQIENIIYSAEKPEAVTKSFPTAAASAAGVSIAA